MKSGLVAARHGSYEEGSKNLNEAGKRQMNMLAAAIKKVADEHKLSVWLLCSTAPRAQQGGEILKEILQISDSNVSYQRCLWDDNSNPGDYGAAEALVDETVQDGRLVVVLSHLDMAPEIARHVRDIKYQGRAPVHELGYGEGLLVTTGKVQVLR